MAVKTFSGSYAPADVIFLLKVIDLTPKTLEERERLIQTGQSHYSEMIGEESPPDPHYLRLFEAALANNLSRLSQDLVKLAGLIARKIPRGPLTLVSLARSGSPVGVVLNWLLKEDFGRKARHYSISIIRDRGIDQNALNFILKERPPKSIVFVDGWTGKGVIARELFKAIDDYNQKQGLNLDGTLAVVSDLAGLSSLSAGTDDYLIPFCLLNSVVSGLISRTILNDSHIGQNDFHGCVYYQGLAPHDLSNWLVATILAKARREIAENPLLLVAPNVSQKDQTLAAQKRRDFMAKAKEEFQIKDANLIKPGLGEATRVLLRRRPGLLVVQDLADPDVSHALSLARAKNVPVSLRPNLPYRAVAIIKNLKSA
ncbi:MAG: cysteine protease StiP family protein [Deltaproteobacteria bacterium]|jgi:hypothetical protein|nr:cysteine protease StiP family protein [Deltaproteobacteria bacterium]